MPLLQLQPRSTTLDDDSNRGMPRDRVVANDDTHPPHPTLPHKIATFRLALCGGILSVAFVGTFAKGQPDTMLADVIAACVGITLVYILRLSRII